MALSPLVPSISRNAYANDLPAGTKTSSYIDINVENIYHTDNDRIAIDLSLNLTDVKMKSQLEQVFTPYLYNGTDTIRFESFSVIGHKRLLSNERNNRLAPITFYKGKLVDSPLPAIKSKNIDYQLYSEGERSTYTLTYSAPCKSWMENATFYIDSEAYGCAKCIKNIPGITNEEWPLAETYCVNLTYTPEYIYVTPVAEAVKMREISARAYIDFVVNRTEIKPDYRRNPIELAKIVATIDSVRNDKDITVKNLHISGTASPEGSYQNNIRLAKGRTEALKNYVQNLYRFPYGVMTTSYEPVDWQGLREFLQQVLGMREKGSDDVRNDQLENLSGSLYNIGGSAFSIAEGRRVLIHAYEILNIVDSNIEPYARNSKIRSTYPREYEWLLANVYPALRHSDYRIQFEIKTYTEVSEILEVLETQPQKLSLAELFVAANSQEPGSELYNRAFELAVLMYPQDQTANLNAAVSAISRGDKLNARRYLSKVTTPSPESDYANAMLLMLEGNEVEALVILNSLVNSSNHEVATKAKAAKEGYERVERENGFHFRTLE